MPSLSQSAAQMASMQSQTVTDVVRTYDGGIHTHMHMIMYKAAAGVGDVFAAHKPVISTDGKHATASMV